MREVHRPTDLPTRLWQHGSNPVADGSQFTVDVAWHTYRKLRDPKLLDKKVLDKPVKTMKSVPRNAKTRLVHIKPGGWDRCPYGFTDSVRKQGDVLFSSLLYVQACRQLADLMDAAKIPEEAKKWRAGGRATLDGHSRNILGRQDWSVPAATIHCKEPDIWGSAFAVYLDVATPRQAQTIGNYFKDHYRAIVQSGQIRHLPGGMYWETACAKDSYQNGGYWATATGWFVYTLDLVDPKLADQTVIDMVRDFQKGGVTEWVLGPRTAVKNYVASATLPLAGVRDARAPHQVRSFRGGRRRRPAVTRKAGVSLAGNRTIPPFDGGGSCCQSLQSEREKALSIRSEADGIGVLARAPG